MTSSNSSSNLPNKKRVRFDEENARESQRDKISNESKCEEENRKSSSPVTEADNYAFAAMVNSVLSRSIEGSSKRKRELPRVPQMIFSSPYPFPLPRPSQQPSSKHSLTSEPYRTRMNSLISDLPLSYPTRGGSSSCIDIINSALVCIESTSDECDMV